MELKNGETYNGTLGSCDHWMNLHLKDVILTSKDGDRFFKIVEVYVRGNTIKYLRVPDDVIDAVDAAEEQRRIAERQRGDGQGAGGRGGYGGGGRGRGRGRGIDGDGYSRGGRGGGGRGGGGRGGGGGGRGRG